MPFDLYFAGSVGKDCTNTIRNLNCCQLLSQLNERRAVNDWVAYKRAHPECTSKLFIDSGAFSAHTKGKEVDVQDYINYINEIDDAVTIFAQLDKIPGTFGKEHTVAEVQEGAEKSWENYLYMKDRIPSRDKLLPIFHEGEDFKWLKNMLEYKHEDGTHIKYIGISSNNNSSTPQKIGWFEEAFRVIKSSSNPNVKTHAFGMTIEDVLEKFPFTSADSTGWIMVGANGGIKVNKKIVCVSDQSYHKPNHFINLSKAVQENVLEKIKEYGFTLQELQDDYSKRQLFNIHSLKEWSDNYKFSGSIIHSKTLF